MFLPISKDYLLVLYDPSTYWLSDPKQPCISISEKDVHHLNLLQSINAYDTVYFSSSAMAEEVTRTVRRSRLKRERAASGHRFIEKSEEGETLDLHRNDINHCCIFRFNKMIRDMRTPLDGQVPERSSPNIKHFYNVMKNYYAGKLDSYDLNNFFTLVEK